MENYSPAEKNIINVLRDNEGVPYEVQDLSYVLGRSADGVRRDLSFLAGRGLISKRRKPNSRANQYFVGKIASDRSDRPIASENLESENLSDRPIASISSPKPAPEASQEAIGLIG